MNGQETIVDVSEEVLKRIQELDLDCLIVVEGTARCESLTSSRSGARPFSASPRRSTTMSLGLTIPLGSDTAVDIAAEAFGQAALDPPRAITG